MKIYQLHNKKSKTTPFLFLKKKFDQRKRIHIKIKYRLCEGQLKGF